jgi:hypothetical protein
MKTYPPGVVQFESQWSCRIVRLPSQESRQSPVAVHHCILVNIVERPISGCGILLCCTIVSLLSSRVRAGGAGGTYSVPLIKRVPCSLPTVLHMSELRQSSTSNSKHLRILSTAVFLPRERRWGGFGRYAPQA